MTPHPAVLTPADMPRDATPYALPPDPEPWKPFPQDPPWDTPLIELNGFWLKTECALHGTVAYPLRLMAAEQGWNTTLRIVIPKLRCRTCKAKPVSVILTNDSYSKRVEHRMG